MTRRAASPRRAAALVGAAAALGGCGGSPPTPHGGPLGPDARPAAQVAEGPSSPAAAPITSRPRRVGPAIDEAAATAALARWLPQVPPFAPYITRLAPTPAVTACLALPKPRAASFCLLDSREEAALPALLELGRRTHQANGSTSRSEAWSDDASASDNAGTIAAMTSFRELPRMVGDPDPLTRRFGMASLAFVVGTMQRGSYVKVSGAALSTAAFAVGNVCTPHLGEPAVDVVIDALHCVAEVGHVPAAPAVAALAAYHRDDAVRAAAASAYPRVSGWEKGRPALDRAVVETMIARLRAPMTDRWTLEDVRAREWTCHALWLSQPEGTPDLGDAAADAMAIMDAHGGGNGRDGGCRRLAEREKTVAPPPRKLQRGDVGPGEQCFTAKSKSAPSFMICLEADAQGSPSIALRDASRLDPAKEKHVRVAGAAVPLDRGVRVSIRESEWHELGPSVRSVFFRLVKSGAREADDQRSLAIWTIDVDRRTFERVAQTAWCKGCDNVRTILSSPRVQPQSYQVIDRNEQRDVTKLDLVWDGARLRRK
jgi:hypothetical protein